MDSVGTRIQALALTDQVLAFAKLAEGRSATRRFTPAHLDGLFDEVTLPRPAKVTNQLSALEGDGLLMRAAVPRGQPNWQLTPRGRERAAQLANDMDLAVLQAEAAQHPLVQLADTPHPIVPPSLAPPELIKPLHAFFADHPFETNVFGMTRFPGSADDRELDPIAPALEAARAVCKDHGLSFHLASDRQIMPDVWPNVAAYLWGCQHGIGFFEERTDRGMSYNLNIEIGSSLVLGRQLAILKDEPLMKMPTDLVGHIYREVDLEDPATVEAELHRWARDDLNLGPCTRCPTD